MNINTLYRVQLGQLFAGLKLEIEQFVIKLLEKLRDTLLPKLMSGEVRVEF